MKHTATPWKHGQVVRKPRHVISTTAKDEYVGLIENGWDAAFIVHACNVHDDLVASLKEALVKVRLAGLIVDGAWEDAIAKADAQQ